MSLSFGHWTVLAPDPSGKRITCRCACSAVIVIELAALDENTACGSCGHRPLITSQQHDERCAEQAQQLTFGW
jgi:hypothetical protein